MHDLKAGLLTLFYLVFKFRDIVLYLSVPSFYKKCNLNLAIRDILTFVLLFCLLKQH